MSIVIERGFDSRRLHQATVDFSDKSGSGTPGCTRFCTNRYRKRRHGGGSQVHEPSVIASDFSSSSETGKEEAA